MAPRKQMTLAIKSSIVTLFKENNSIAEISKKVGYSSAAVSKFLKKFDENGSFERKSGSGPKRKTTEREDRLLKLKVLQNRFASASSIRKQLSETNYRNVSIRTVERRLNETGFYSYRPAKKPLLTKLMRRSRLQWAKDHKNWTLDDWSRVIFSDETKFNLFGQDGKQNVRRRSGERFHPSCITQTVRHSPSVMIWGCITIMGSGKIEIVEGTLNAEKYKNILKNSILPTIEELTELTSQPIFQDDSAPCHRARSIVEFKEEMGIESMTWPGNSPDLNIIENVWALMGNIITNLKPTTVEEMKKCILQVWENKITKETIQNLYKSIPRRVSAVIKAKGGPTKY